MRKFCYLKLTALTKGVQVYLYFRRIFKPHIASQGGLLPSVALDIPEIHCSTVQLLVGVDQQSQAKLPAGSPVQLVPVGVDVQLVADLTLQDRLLEGRAHGLAELRDSSAQDGEVVTELTEGDEGGERGVGDVGRMGDLSGHCLLI